LRSNPGSAARGVSWRQSHRQVAVNGVQSRRRIHLRHFAQSSPVRLRRALAILAAGASVPAPAVPGRTSLVEEVLRYRPQLGRKRHNFELLALPLAA